MLSTSEGLSESSAASGGDACECHSLLRGSGTPRPSLYPLTLKVKHFVRFGCRDMLCVLFLSGRGEGGVVDECGGPSSSSTHMMRLVVHACVFLAFWANFVVFSCLIGFRGSPPCHMNLGCVALVIQSEEARACFQSEIIRACECTSLSKTIWLCQCSFPV